MAYPVAPKAQAAGVAGAISGAAVWALSTYEFKGNVDPGLVSLIYAAAPGLVAFGAAYMAPHQPRPNDEPPVPDLTDEQAAAFKAALESALPRSEEHTSEL